MLVLLSMKLQRLCPHAEERRSRVSKYEAPLFVLLSMKLQRLCPHAEERRSRVSKYEVAPVRPSPT
jgi:hypothetical protein